MRFVTGRLNEWVNNIEKEGFPKKSLKGGAVFSGLLATTSEKSEFTGKGALSLPYPVSCTQLNYARRSTDR